MKKILNSGNKKITLAIAIFLILLIMSIFSENSVQASERIGKTYLLDEGYITKIMPETSLSDFQDNLATEEHVEVIDKNGNSLEQESYIGTGMSCKIGENTYKLSVLGDVTGNGKISITDLVKTKLHVIKLKELEQDFQKSADINNDEEISITDLTAINLIQIRIIDINDYALTPIGPTESIEPTPVYATLYADGTLGLSSTPETIQGKTVSKFYGDVSNAVINEYYDVPWYSDADSIETIDIVNVIAPTNMAYWFNRLWALTTINNMQNIDTSYVTSMKGLFYKSTSITSLDLSNFDISNVTDISEMFDSAYGLTTIYVEYDWITDTADITHLPADVQIIIRGNALTSSASNLRSSCILERV